MRGRPTRILIAGLIAALVAVNLVACTQTPAAGMSSDFGEVTAHGFTLHTATASATAGAGVAKPKTPVTLTTVQHQFTESRQTNYTGIGQAVKLSLPNNAQPKTPITIRFKIDQAKVSKASWSTPKTYAVLTQPAGSSTTTLMPATYDAKTGELAVITDHLSFFQPIQFNIPGFLNSVGDSILKGLNITYDQPDCKGQTSVTIGDTQYSIGSSWALTPCLTNDAGT